MQAQEAEQRIKKNVHSTLVQDFIRVMEKYEEIQAQFKHRHEENVTRQVLTGKYRFGNKFFQTCDVMTKYGNAVNPSATTDEIADVIQSGDAERVFATSIQRDQQAQLALNYIRVRSINTITRIY